MGIAARSTTVLATVVLAAALSGAWAKGHAPESQVPYGGAAPSSVVSNPDLWDLARSHAHAGSADVPFSGSTDLYGNPIILSTFDPSVPHQVQSSAVQCDDDTQPSWDKPRSHPRLMAPGYMWKCLPQRIAHDGYLTLMNESVFINATAWYEMPPTNYSIDGGYAGSGILDVAREVQRRVRAWAYAYRSTGDSKWVDRTWTELHVAAGNTSQPFGQGPSPLPDQHWNPAHFLDTGEMTTAFAIGYDWLYDAWTEEQRQAIKWSIISLGLTPGLNAYNGDLAIGWWQNNGFGNWNVRLPLPWMTSRRVDRRKWVLTLDDMARTVRMQLGDLDGCPSDQGR